MRHILGVILAGGVLLGQGSVSKAQVNLSLGNPYTGPSVTIGQPNAGYGYGNTAGYYGTNTYGMNPTTTYGSTGYPSNVYGMPAGTSYYSSGYQGYTAPPPYTYGSTGYNGTAYTAPVYGYNRYVMTPTYGTQYSYGRRGLFGAPRMRTRRGY
jgi:hypothetical protein